ncbi:MAG: T9SS type A sorting domain-containing protein [Bacteroidia bacterium]|nr:T9SS type A sorting domain-containing protein [Bacteroidia bacterium]
MPLFLQAQHNTAVIDNALTSSNEYGSGNVNNYTSGGQTWYITWDATYVYVHLVNANVSEFGIMYFDINPIAPVNGGNNTNGSIMGLPGFDNLTPNLPMRADAAIVFKDNLRGVYAANGSGGWNVASFGAGAFSLTPSDITANWYATGSNNRELKISWNQLTAGAGIPASFNWFGYCSYNCSNTCGGMYGAVPNANPGGTFAMGSTPDCVRYFTVSSTANGSSTNPTSRDSYTHLGGSITNFGDIVCYDFTMNSPGQVITRLTGPGFKDWNINGTLLVNAGQIYFGAYNVFYGVADYGLTTINNIVMTGGELNLDYTTSTTLVLGNITLTGGLFYLGDRTFAGHGDLELRGNWFQSTGFFGINHKTVYFRGNTLQTIAGNGTLFPYVEINNAAGVTILSGNQTIQDTLYLLNGMLTLGNNQLTITGLNGQTPTSTGGITYTNPSSFIVTDGNGVLRQNDIGTARTGSILFPIGNSSTSYRPLTLNNSGTNDNFAARVFNNVYSGGNQGVGTTFTTNYVNRTWDVSETVAGGSTLTATFEYAAVDELVLFNRNLCGVATHNGSAWVLTQTTGPVAGSNPYTRTTTVNTTGHFTITSDLIPLPIQWLSFEVTKQQTNATLQWAVLNQNNASHYEIQRSLTGNLFEPIGIVTANPNGYYTYSDNISKRSNEIIYYRIKQYDFNGNYTYSMVKSIANKLQSPLLIFPNPAYDVLAIKHPKIGQAALTVYNSNGQLCYSLQSVFDSDQTEIKINHLISGLYTIQLTTQSGMVYQNRFIKR